VRSVRSVRRLNGEVRVPKRVELRVGGAGWGWLA
jgi:hypothetical protein